MNESYATTYLQEDLKHGKCGEEIFSEDYLEFFNVKYSNVTNVPSYQMVDVDFTSSVGTFDVKNSYRDNKKIIIEDYTNINQEYGNVSTGWFYKSQADILVFVSSVTRAMILVPFTESFKSHYENIKDKYTLNKNKVSQNRFGDQWQSAYRIVPLDDMKDYFAYYKKVTL